MRRIWCIGSLLAAVFMAACNSNKQVPEPVEGPSPALSSVDSLMWEQPDSALACLLPYFDTCCRDADRQVSTVYNRHYAHLLLAELLYKNDYAQTNRAELLDAVGYFDSLTFTLNDHSSPRRLIAGGDPLSPTRNDQLFFLSARAHYINGVGYYEQDSVVPACKEYLKAMELMEEHFEEKNLMKNKIHFVALVYIHLSGLYSDYYLHEQTISCAKHSLSYLQKQDSSSWHIAWVLNTIGSQYEMIREFDSAYYYYKRATTAINDTTLLLYRDICSHQAMLEYKTDNQKAEAAMSTLFHLLSASDSEMERLARYSCIGEILFQEQQFDSAWKYLNIVFNNVTNTGFKKQAAEWLVEICKVQKRNDEIIKYAGFLVPFANLEENKSEIKSQLTELYNEYSQNKLERQHLKDISHHRKLSMMAYLGLFFIILIVVILYHYNKRRKLHLENQIKEEKRAHIMEKKSLSSRLKKSNASLRELQDQIKKQNSNSSIKPEAKAATFMEEPICRLILERVRKGQFKSQMDCSIYKSYALTKEQIIALHDAANRHYDHFTERLVQTHPNLTKSDLDYCCLYLLGLTDADMSALMQRAYNTINERNSKLRRIFGCEGMISVTLQSFANRIVSN